MGDRLSVLVGAGVVTAGVSAAMLAGAGVATATAESETAGATTTSESVQSDPSGPADTAGDDSTDGDDSTNEGTGADGGAGTDESTGTDEVEEPADEAGSEPAEPAEVVDAEAGRDRDEEPAAEQQKPVSDGNPHETDADDEIEEPAEESALEPVGGIVAEEPAQARADVIAAPEHRADPATDQPEPEMDQPDSVAGQKTLAAFTSAPSDAAGESRAAPPRQQTLLSAIGTIIFNIYSVAVRVLGGPPLLPWGSTVTVRSSSLTIDRGDGYEVPADWYVPAGPPPTRLIHLQHGFLASGAFYSHTAARLAEATHSIVVATSLTSNFLACDGCWVGGSPMHKAVAGLFVDGNTALAQSAMAAGYGSTLLDGVQKIALVGHSAGGGLAAGAAGYMSQNGAFAKLAGVVMLDGVGFGDVTRVPWQSCPRTSRSTTSGRSRTTGTCPGRRTPRWNSGGPAASTASSLHTDPTATR